MLAAIVPTKNEERTIGSLIRHLAQITTDIFVADDSDDQTAFAALSEGAFVVDAPPGLGPAYLEAWHHVPAAAYVVHVDAGASHPIRSVYAVASAAPTADIVIGSRFMAGGRHVGSPLRKLSSRLMAAAMNLVTLYKISDWTSGLRAYSPKARAYLGQLEYTTKGHAWQIEALWAALQHGLTVVEVPIDYQAGESQLNVGRVLEAVKLWWSITWS